MTASDNKNKSASVKTVDVMRPFIWIQMGWRDMVRCGWVSYLHGILFALFGGLVFLWHVNGFGYWPVHLQES